MRLFPLIPFAALAGLLPGLLGACDQVTSLPAVPDAAVASSGWTVMAAGTRNLNAVSGVSDSAVWVVGDLGTVGYWNGSQLTFEQSGTTANLRGVWAVDADHVYAVGDGGVILERLSGVWQQVGAKTTQQVLTAVWADSTRVFAVGSNGTIVAGTATGYALLEGTVSSGGDAGAYSENLFGVSGVPGGTVTIVGALGLVLQIPAGGTSVSRVTVPMYSGLLSAAALSGTTTFLVGQQGAVYTSATAYMAPIMGCPQNALRAVTTTTTSDVWAAGWDGTICKITGSSAVSFPFVDARWFNGIYASSPATLWVVGASGTLLHGYPATPDGGAKAAPIGDGGMEGGG